MVRENSQVSSLWQQMKARYSIVIGKGEKWEFQLCSLQEYFFYYNLGVEEGTRSWWLHLCSNMEVRVLSDKIEKN